MDMANKGKSDDQTWTDRFWAHAEMTKAEASTAITIGVKWRDRGPLGPTEGGPSTWRGHEYREGPGRWGNRGTESNNKFRAKIHATRDATTAKKARTGDSQEVWKASEEIVEDWKGSEEIVEDWKESEEIVEDWKASEEIVEDWKASEEIVEEWTEPEEVVEDWKASDETVEDWKASEETVEDWKESEEIVEDWKASEEIVDDWKESEEIVDDWKDWKESEDMHTRYIDDEQEDWKASEDADVQEVIGDNWTGLSAESEYIQAGITRLDRYIKLRKKRCKIADE